MKKYVSLTDNLKATVYPEKDRIPVFYSPLLFLYPTISVVSDCALQLQCLVQLLCVLVTPQSWCDDVTHMAG